MFEVMSIFSVVFKVKRNLSDGTTVSIFFRLKSRRMVSHFSRKCVDKMQRKFQNRRRMDKCELQNYSAINYDAISVICYVTFS